jgi:hypothetical protein
MKNQILLLLVLLQPNVLHAGLGYSIAQSADYGGRRSPLGFLIRAIDTLDTHEARRLIEQDETLPGQYQELFREKEPHLRLVGTSPLESLIREKDPRSVDMLALLLEKGISPDGFWRSEQPRNNLGGILGLARQYSEPRYEKILLLLQAGVDPVPITFGQEQDFLHIIGAHHEIGELSDEQKCTLQNAYATCCAEHEKRETAPLKAQGAALARALPDALQGHLPVADLHKLVGNYATAYYGWPEEIDESKTDY